jgi:phage-related baseplate assembly protein
MRFSAATLDLSLLPAPQAIKPLDYDADLAARIADLKTRLIAAGIAFDTDTLETEPTAILQQTSNYRELLTKAAINDAVRAVMLALATGNDLDNLGAIYDCERLIVTPATDSTPVVMESDSAYRFRVLLAPEAFSCAGTTGGYVFHALTADPLIKDVGVRTLESIVETALGPALDRVVEVALLTSVGDGTASDDILIKTRARLLRTDIKPLTDVVSVVSATIIPYTVTGTVYVPPGPDPLAVKAQAEAAVDKAAADANRVGLKLYKDTFLTALRVGPSRHAVLSLPDADLGGPGQAPFMSGKTITVEVIDE